MHSCKTLRPMVYCSQQSSSGLYKCITTIANYACQRFSVFRSWKGFYRRSGPDRDIHPSKHTSPLLTGPSHPAALSWGTANQSRLAEDSWSDGVWCDDSVWPLTLCSLQPPIAFTLQIITAPLKPLSPSSGTAMEIGGGRYRARTVTWLRGWWTTSSGGGQIEHHKEKEMGWMWGRD